MSITYSTPLPANPSAQLKFALKFFEAGLSADKDEFAKFVTDDYLHVYLPTDAGLPVWNKDAFQNHMEVVNKLIDSLVSDVKEIIEAPGVVMLYMKVIAVDKEGVKSEQEVLHIVYVVEQPDGSLKVAKLKEFVDTAKWVHFAEVMKKKMAAA